MNDKQLGFLLKTTKLSDSRLILTVLTKDMGKVTGVHRIGRKAPHGFLTPMSCIHFERSGREQQNLKTIKDIHVASHVYNFASRYLGLTLLNHWSFLLDKTQPEEHSDPAVYRLLEHALQGLRPNLYDARQLRFANLYFEMWLLHFGGVLNRHHPDQSGLTNVSAEVRFARRLPTQLFDAVYRHQLPGFLEASQDWQGEAAMTTALGQMWQLLLDRELPPRSLFLNQALNH